MKIIDLLNMIANGEEMPERIKYNGVILKYMQDAQDYSGIESTGSGSFFNYLFVNFVTKNFINNEVELLEDEEIDIQNIEEIPKILYISLNEVDVRTGFNNIIDNQNQILQAVKKLDKQIKEK